MARTCAALMALFFAGCFADSAPSPVSHDGGIVLEYVDAAPDSPEPATPLDSGPTCNGNGGIVCIEDTDCPKADGCPYYFRCEFVPGQDPKKCVAYPLDGGTP
jgi:hypothetical protein